MNKETLNKILENHKKWLNDEGGERADLRGADLSGANLRGANLSCADLRGANLRGADLRGANLREANLSGADLRGANLRGADLSYADLSCADLSGADLRGDNLSGANLSCADLRGANLRGADLRGANLRGADLSYADLSYADLREAINYFMQCPEEGEFIAYKKCQNGVIVKLKIPSDAKRSSATSRKCRASKAIVLEIEGADIAYSKHDPSFTYKVGDVLEVKDFDDDRWNECAPGIHFFITRQEAVDY